MASRIKIIHLQLLPLMSGVQKVTLDELSHLDRETYESVVICKCEGEFTENLRRIGVRVHLVSELERDIRPASDVRAFIKLYAAFKAEKPAIVHTHSSKTGVLGRLAAWCAGVPLIVHTVHGFAFPGEPRRFVRAIFKFLEQVSGKVTDRMIVLNDADAAIARNLLAVPDTRQVMLPNGVDTDAYAPAPAPTRHALRQSILGVTEDSRVIIGMIGRLWLQKNPQCFVRAAIQVLNKRSNVGFYLIGDGEFREELEATIRESGHSDAIRILGWRRDVPDVLKALDLMVLPSRWEGMPLAILEAMSSAVPVVASDIPGNSHLVRDRVDGRLFPTDDADSLASMLIDLIDHPDKRSSYSAAARHRIVSGFTLSDRISRITSIYEASLRMRRPA
jgi:glycosyltransferase involved in cell wall biosynthesis